MAEVASVGGFVKQYSVVIDPRRLQALGIPLSRIRDAIRDGNMDVGSRTVEVSETEFSVRGRGYIKNLSDLEQIVVKSEKVFRCSSRTLPAWSSLQMSGGASRS